MPADTTITTKSGYFSIRSTFPFSVEELFSWHERDGAIERLSPPWAPIEVVHKTGGIQPGARVTLRMREGPISYHWRAEHTEYKKDRLFRDQQTRGPFSQWRHTHRFEPTGESQCLLEDTIEFAPFVSPLSGRVFNPIVHKKLSRIFRFRHETTAADLAIHTQFKEIPRKKILISGASGLIGQKLIPFLSTGGHTVSRLVRRNPTGEGEIFWNPAKGELRAADIEGIDAVIHLAGENVGEGRWTRAKKKRIVESRVLGTQLLSNTVSQLNRKPEVFISASATGYYGDHGTTPVTEEAPPGDTFLASVCDQWEKAAQPAIDNGIRTVFMRIGMVLTPEGGALGKLHLPYRLGLGGRIGTGEQHISWIGIDDTLSAFYWTLMNPTLSGPVNLVAPHAVTNRLFSQTLASVLSRPSLFPLPAFLIKLLFGQMGEEGLLTGTNASPEKLARSGFTFRHPTLRETLRHVLGK